MLNDRKIKLREIFIMKLIDIMHSNELISFYWIFTSFLSISSEVNIIIYWSSFSLENFGRLPSIFYNKIFKNI